VTVREITDADKLEWQELDRDLKRILARMNELYADTGRDYRTQVSMIRTGPPMVIDDDGETYWPDKPGRRIGSERAEREDEAEPLSADDDDGEDA
jgi:hypothetical protein